MDVEGRVDSEAKRKMGVMFLFQDTACTSRGKNSKTHLDVSAQAQNFERCVSGGAGTELHVVLSVCCSQWREKHVTFSVLFSCFASKISKIIYFFKLNLRSRTLMVNELKFCFEVYSEG